MSIIYFIYKLEAGGYNRRLGLRGLVGRLQGRRLGSSKVTKKDLWLVDLIYG